MITRISLSCLIAFLGYAVGLFADELAPSPILDVFPRSVAQTPADAQGKTDFSSRFTPSASLWDERLDEKQVFQLEIAHQQDAENSFKLRMGKGGQIYSLRGAFGESVPPSWRAANNHISPWNDEVWQFVAVCTTYNGVEASLKAGKLPDETIARMKNSAYRNGFFIHNSGAYIPGESAIDSLYCPLLASEVRESDRCYRMLNWGLVPQIKTVHRSPLLYYTQVRDVGDGVIELTWVVHNFSVRDDVVFDHLNAPWGGTRVTSLPLRYVSSPDGKLIELKNMLNSAGVVPVRKTGGWNLSCASEADDNPSLALVYGTDRHLEAERAREAAGEPFCQFNHSLYRDWRANAPAYEKAWKDWRTRPANSFRNYDVCEVIPKLRIAPQTTIWYRSFLVVGRREKTIKLAQSLVDKVDYGLLRFDSESTHARPVSIQDGKVKLDNKPEPSSKTFEVFTRPVSGTRPLFLIQNTETDQQIITTDPYHFVEKERVNFQLPTEHPHYDYYKDINGYSLEDNNSNWRSLIGFGFEQKPESGSWMQLSALVDPKMFPKPDRYHLDLWVKAPRDVGQASPLASDKQDAHATLRKQVLALGALTDAPKIYPAEGFAKDGGIKPIYYDGLPWQGKPTRVFAWLGLPQLKEGPKSESKVPGIVLVHGGGGTAFKEWVKKWNAQGFAAISIAVEGQTDRRTQAGKGWKRHDWAGPARDGIYGDSDEPLADQWMYHAVADTILANSLVRSLPQVDPDKVGVMGISWGGIITSTVIGIDGRFAFGIPTYGCGDLADVPNQYGRALGKNTLYREMWDPMVRMKNARLPTLWLSWTGDQHFPLDSLRNCYVAAPGAHMVALLPNMRHGHAPGWNPPDSYAFAKSVVQTATPWCGQLGVKVDGVSARVSFTSTKPIDRATLISTSDTGFTGSRKWTEFPAEVKQTRDRVIVNVTLPTGTRAWFVSIQSGTLVASSDFQETKAR